MILTDPVKIVLITNIFSIIMFFVKSEYDRRRTNDKTKERDAVLVDKVERRDQILVEKVEGIAAIAGKSALEVTSVKEMLEVHIEENDFTIKFKNTLQNKSSLILAMYGNLAQGHKNILDYWADTIERFGMRFYYSDFRKAPRTTKEEISRAKHNLEIFLNTCMDVRLNNLNDLIHDTFPKPKTTNKKKLYFSDFLAESQLHNKTQLLILALVENGLSQNEIILKFENYLAEFYQKYLDLMVIFSTLIDYEPKDID